MYRLKIPKEAKKELKIIRSIYGTTVVTDALLDIKESPFIGKPLERDLTGRFSYRIGVYRIIYKINEKDKLVEIITAGHRATVY